MAGLEENFMMLVNTATIVCGTLAIFFAFVYYQITVDVSHNQREAYTFGNMILSSDCLTYQNTKALFSQGKLDAIDPTCFKYSHGNVTISLLDSSNKWSFKLGSDSGLKAEFIVAVKLSTGEVKPANMTVMV